MKHSSSTEQREVSIDEDITWVPSRDRSQTQLQGRQCVRRVDDRKACG